MTPWRLFHLIKDIIKFGVKCYIYSLRKPWRDMGIFKKKPYVNRYIELCNPFSRFSNSFPRISNSFPRIGQLILSDCNSFPRIRQSVLSICNSFPRIGQLVLSDCNSFPRIRQCVIRGNELLIRYNYLLMAFFENLHVPSGLSYIALFSTLKTFGNLSLLICLIGFWTLHSLTIIFFYIFVYVRVNCE